MKNIFCYDNLFRELIGPAIDCSESHTIRQQGKIARLIHKLIFSVCSIDYNAILNEKNQISNMIFINLTNKFFQLILVQWSAEIGTM